MMKTIAKLENGGFDLDEFTADQKTFIMAVAKMAYADGVDAALSDSLNSLVVPADWTPINPPTLKDDEIYDICLHSNEVIEEVDFWAFGGGFMSLFHRQSGALVAYPFEKVRSFKLHNSPISGRKGGEL